MKLPIFFVLFSLTQAAYISRMTTVNRPRPPTAFRPGVNLQRYWTPQRLVPAASQRVPYVVYRNQPYRFAVKPIAPAHRNVHLGSWKTTARLPLSSTTEFDFLRAASAPPVHINGGAIHTIPAPNLSLSEKPIVVVDASESILKGNAVSQAPKPIYEVTEKYQEPEYHMAKIETPIGFSKATPGNSPELQNLIRNGAYQVSSDYGLSAISIPQNGNIGQHQIPVQTFNGIPTHQDLINSGAEGIVIPPNALYQPDPMFLQKLQTQLVQRFPSVEFIPYSADAPSAPVPQNQQNEAQPHLLYLENDEIKQEPSSFVPMYQKNIVQRETQESSAVTLAPETVVVNNITEKPDIIIPPLPNITVDLVASESQPITTTIKYIIETNKVQNATPIFYAQIGQSIGDVIAKGFYSALNDVRAAAALAQIEKSPESNTIADKIDNVTTTTINPDLKPYFTKTKDGKDNATAPEFKSLLGMPFKKASDSVNVAYTLLRTDAKEPKMSQEGKVYAGQIVEASVSEDEDYNKDKAFMSRRAPIRLVGVPDKTDILSAAASNNQEIVTSSTEHKAVAVKAKIPPKSKLVFDDNTGEPILRIYASYSDNPSQKESITTKLQSLKHVKDAATRKEISDNWKSPAVKSADKTLGFEGNQVTEFGLKLKARNDEYIPLLDEYED